MSPQTAVVTAPIPTRTIDLMAPEHREYLVRRVAKEKFAGRAYYWQAPDVNGIAMACNLGGGEVLLRLGNFLTPGETVHLKLDCVRLRGVPVELTAEVCWCRAADGDGCIIAMAKLVKDFGPRYGAQRVTFDSLTVSSSATASDVE